MHDADEDIGDGADDCCLQTKGVGFTFGGALDQFKLQSWGAYTSTIVQDVSLRTTAQLTPRGAAPFGPNTAI